MNDIPLVLLLAWLGYLLAEVLKTYQTNSRPITINIVDPPEPPTLHFHAPNPPPPYRNPEDDDDDEDDDDHEPEAPPPTGSSPEKRPELEPIHNRLSQHLN